eukprot:TRINITY_DN4265_c0_g2_i2.p1 TRINITY_DN4265_c0_g2~~TRINITY_DN4265_c0_g2_i2.p1  ORF type:complete len:109 (+),score=22.13 TRINITY_DN4265_c0_g2_i2:43-369(+)
MRSIFTMQNAARPFCSFALSFLKGVSASAVSISHTRGRNLSFVGVRMYSIPQEVKRRKTRLLLQQHSTEMGADGKSWRSFTINTANHNIIVDMYEQKRGNTIGQISND